MTDERDGGKTVLQIVGLVLLAIVLIPAIGIALFLGWCAMVAR